MDPFQSHLKQLERLQQLLLTLQEDDFQHKGANEIDDLQQSSQLLHLDSNRDGDSNKGSHDGPLTTLKRLPGRGIGIVATRPIPAGCIIHSEAAAMTFPYCEDGDEDAEHYTKIVGAFVDLPAGTRQQILSLHACKVPHYEKCVRTFLAAHGDVKLTKQQTDFVARLCAIGAVNVWGDGDRDEDEDSTQWTSSLFLKTSRLNHSCLPNCAVSEKQENGRGKITVYTSRDIQPNEELTVTYLDANRPRDRRRAHAKHVWDFDCNCPACDYNNPAVDTAKHEEVLAEYRRLEHDSCLTINMDPLYIPLPLKDLDDAFHRSMRRAEIAKSLGDMHDTFQETLLSAQILHSEWRLSGDEQEIQRQIKCLESALLLVKKYPLEVEGYSMKKRVKLMLRAAKGRQGDQGKEQWAYLRENQPLMPRGDKLMTATVMWNVKLSNDQDPVDFIEGRISLEELGAEVRTLVGLSGHNLEEILRVAREETADCPSFP
ncbi:hypothetical protein Daus18300_005625 [Diaporthe australafricana]|uniref:SET domain-containing protein n=1 Tax=Diaporthe australafricana TaxID=127596 RepID=A0ABR3X162_9PEZI